MITFTRVANIAPGKMPSAIEFAQRSAAYMKQAYGVEFQVSVPIGGNPMRVCWTTQTDSMAKMDELNQKLLVDKKYASMVAEYGDSMLPGSLLDSFWHTI